MLKRNSSIKMSVPAMSIITGILLFMLLSVFNAQAANRYAVVTGNWNSTATWSATSGGTGGASVPVAGDAVYIEGGHNVTITANAGCSSVSFTTTTATLLNINAGITLDVSGAVTIPKSGSSVNTLAVGAGFLNAGSVSFTGTGSTKRHEITISTGTVMVTGNVSGTTTSATITFTGAGLLKLGGAFFTSSTGTLTPATGTVEYNASGAQTVGDFAYNNLTLSGSGAKTTDAVTVNGILSMEGTATVTIAPTYGTSASLVYNTATSHVAGLEWVTPFAATGGITIANTGTISLNSAEVFNASIPLIINSGASLSTAGFQLTLGGDFINNGGTFNAGSSPVVISNTKLIQSIDGFTTTGLVSVTKSAGIATMQNNVTAGGLTINGTGGTLNLGAGFTHSVTGAVTLSAGTLNGGTNTILAVSGNWTRNSGVYAAGTGSVNFIGGSLQTIGGSSSTTFNNLGINNSAGVSLSIAVAVGGTLTLTSGVMTTGSSALTVSNSSSTAVTGGSATSFISGPLTWSLSAGQTYSFPVGKSSTYLPFGLTGITGTNPQIRVEAFSGNTGGTASPPLTSLSTTEYWFASVTANTYSGGSVSLTRQAALNEFEAVGRNASSLNGAYGSLNGTVSGTSIINSDNTGNSLGYFVMASKLSITTGTINPASYCPGSSVIVPYSKTGTFSAGNVFTAQLSDAVGSFASPVIIGSLASQLSGTISATIPVGQSSGSGYRIRVVSSSPSFTGSDNGVNLYIGGPVITATYPGSSCGPGPVVLGATASFGTISWYAAATGGSALGTGTTFTTPSLSVTTTYYVDVISGSCTSAPRTPVMAYIITPPTMTAGGGGTFCYSSNITLTSSGTNISNQYWEGPNSFYSVEQNPVISAATTAMSGTYTVTGSALSGINLVANGDFELGNVGFGSGYVASSDLLLEGTYAVVADPRSVHSGYSTCADHTPSGTLQMVVNGSIIAGVNVWTQTVSVLPGTDYQFSYWVQSVVASNPSQLQLYINGVAAGPVYTALLATCQWKQFVYNWNSGASSSAILSLQNQNTIATGNDFTLDDILFQSVCTATAGDFATGNNGIQLTPVISSTVLVTVNANVTAGSIGTAQSICRGYTPATLTSVAAGTGSGTITYEWQTNASGSFATVSGATSATYSPPALSTTTIYQRRTVSLSGGTTCYSPYTSQITITVTGPTVSAGGPNSVCQSASPTALTLTGASFGGATTAAWSIISGGGVLSSTAQTANPSAVTYTPAVNYSGTVILRLTTNAVSGCASIADRTITVSALPVAVISYAGTPFCISVTSAQTVTRTGTAGGTYTASPAGLTIDAVTGSVTPSTSTAGSYTVTYTIASSGGCSIVTATTSVTITSLPVATFSYTGTPYCSNGTNPTPVFSGGGVAGTFSSTAGLNFVSTSTGQVNLSTSTPGTYTVANTIGASGGCALVSSISSITITTLPAAAISYAGSPFCKSVATAQAVTRTGSAGGTYTASPAGLTVDAVTGSVTPSTSTAGSYTVTYTIASSGGCSIVTATTSVTITSLPVATFSYTGTPYCSNGTNPSPVFSGGGVAGTFSSTAGLNFVSTSTGQVNLSTSTPGTYTVANTIGASGGCAQVSSTSSITITTLPAAVISYTGTPFCKSVVTAQAVTRTGSAGGTYTASPAGLTVDAVTGSVTPSTSTAGSYTVTYTIASSGGCSIVTATTPVTITAVPTATISYAGTPFCTSVALAQPVTLGGTGAYSGGTYAATPAGLTINASTGAITPGTSTAGSYTITYTVPSSGGCAAVPVTTPVVITAMPSATISYAGTPFCQTVSSSQPVTLTGTQGGAFSASPAGLVISPATGAITPGSSASGSYTVTYSIPASGGCAATSATTNVTVNALPVATFSYTGSPYCSNAANPLPTFSGGGVAGIFSSSPGLVFVSTATGEINLLSTTPGTYSVVNNIAANGGCEAVSASSLVTVNPIAPQTPGAISGTTSQCPGQTDQSYSITAVAGATVYTWSVPAGWTITSGAGTTSIRVTTGTAGQNGNISVTAGNDCGTSSASTLAVSVSPVEVVASLGSADACYPTLKAAFDKINDGTHGGVITIKLHGSTTETISAVLNASGTGSASFTSVNIFPTVTGVVISGNLATPLIDLNGADNVTIDGRVNALGSSKDLVVTNSSSSSAAATSTIRFANNASANTIKYCVLKGSETATTGGIVFFSTSSSAGTGNDNNLIDNNNITCDADANRPLNAIYSAGTSSKVNSGNTISNNNIYDFLSRSATSNGINIAGNSQDFTISGNSFYETSTLVVSASSVIYNVIYLNNSSGTGFSVSGNYIGGKSAQCGGDAWSKNTQNSVFSAINVNVGTAVASSIQNNTIRNFSWSNSSNASWTGINVAAGAVNIGTLSGNVIGASSGTNSIVITAASNNANLYGINIAGTGSVDCQNNFIGSITAANGSSNASNIFGINRTAEVGTTTISNNTIGSATTDNSINASSASTSNNQNVYGIFNNGTGTITVNNNTIANLTNGTTRTTTSGTGRINGITSVNGINVISGNTIYDLSIANGNTALNNSSVCGIALTGSTLKTVTGNTIYNLSNTYASFAGDVIGLYFTGNTGANLISGNFIHSLSITGVSSTIGEVYGIVAASGSATYSNNIINLGGNTKTTLYGIYETGASGNSDGLYFNTVYIGGTLASGSTNKSYALLSAGNSNTCNFRDNIFVNERSTTGGSSLHYGIYFAATGGSFTTDYNDYFVSGTGSVLGYYGSNKTSLSAWQAATSQDSGSLDANPDFTLAGSTVTTDYKIHRDLPGITISGITTDFGGTLRVLPSMGAWEKNLRKWKGSVSNNFANAANWSDGTVPLAGESVIFDDNPDQDCYLDQDRTIGSLTINQALDKMVLNGYRLSLNSNLNLTDGGKIDAASANSTMAFTGSSLQTINAGAFVQNSVANLTVNNSVGVSLTGDLDVNGNLDLANGPLQLGTVTLGINGSITRTAGSVTAGSTSGVKIGGSGSQLIIPANCFTGSSVNDFTINRASGVSLSSSLSVSGILDLHVANPSSTRGCLETGNNILSMGALSTTTGPGDVNGIVTRSSFPSNGPYSFGNQFTTMTFSAGGTVPSTIGVKITLGAAPSWKPDAILRTYDIIQSGGTAKPVSMNLHYLNSELNGIPDTLLYAWDFHAATNPIRLEKRTRTSQSTTDHWVGTSLTDVGYFGTSYNEHPWTLARTNYVTFMGLKGWRMITAPTITTSSDILSNFISQGVAGSSYPGKQPNFLWFNETDTLTTNMSWRTSKYDSIIVPGRGYYFYVFDSVSQASAAAPVYSDKLPRRMTSSGNAYFPGNFSYSLSNHHVTFTPRVGGQTHTSVNDTIFYDTNVDDQGWNLLGNPTLSTLNWNSSHGWTKTNLDSTIYIWDPAINQFRVWNGINGNLGSGLISPFQAFWVRANNPNPALSFTDEVLTTGGTFYGGTSVKSAQFNPVPSAINLNLKSAGLEGDIIVSFKEDGKVGPDPWDAYRLQPLSNSSIEVFTLSSPSHTMPLVINNLPSDGPDCIILPLYTGGQLNGREITGTYTLNWELPPDWPADWAISLNDHSEKKAISMKREHSYTFTIGNTKSSLDENAQDSVSPLVLPSLINPVSVSSRLKSSTGSSPFSIVIQKGSTKDDPIYISPEPNLLPNFPNPFADQTTIRLSLPSAAYVTLKIFDIRGVLIDVVADRNYEAGSYSIPWTRNGQNAGIYLLQMDAGAVVKTKKLVIIN